MRGHQHGASWFNSDVPKYLAAHLTGVAWAAHEHDSIERGFRILQRWLDSPGTLVKPTLPPDHGVLTIADIAAAIGVDDYQSNRHQQAYWPPAIASTDT